MGEDEQTVNDGPVVTAIDAAPAGPESEPVASDSVPESSPSEPQQRDWAPDSLASESEIASTPLAVFDTPATDEKWHRREALRFAIKLAHDGATPESVLAVAARFHAYIQGA